MEAGLHLPAASIERAVPSATPPDPDRFPLSDDEITAIVNPANATEYTGKTGAVEGIVKVKGAPPQQRPLVLPPGCEGATEIHGPSYRATSGGGLSDVLIAVTNVAGYVRPSHEDRAITIRNCSVEPRVIDLTVGQRLLVSSEDSLAYIPQVPIPSRFQRLILKGQSAVPVMVTRPGIFALSWLSGSLQFAEGGPTATVFALASALHTVTGPGGTFRVAGIPVGKAKLVAWHVALGEQTQIIEVKEGAVAHAEFTFVANADAPKGAASASASASGAASPSP